MGYIYVYMCVYIYVYIYIIRRKIRWDRLSQAIFLKLETVPE